MAAALLRRLTAPDADADLLRRFAESRDEAAFAELVRRHGPAVYRVCRRLVGPHADDAFQATFLILATRARAVREPGAVGGWLIGVAGRVARQMRKAEGRHARWRVGGVSPLVERPGGWQQQGANAPRSPETADLARVLDEELTRLPDRLRGPAVLCLVEGRTQEQAAADLGGSVRTVRRRLDEARALLRLRLERRGVVPAVATALVAGAGDGLATVSASLVQATVGVAFDFLAGGARTAPAAVIAKGVTMTLFARKLAAGLVAAAVGLVGLGVGFADDGAKPTPAGTTIPPQNLPATPPVKPTDPPSAKRGPAAHATANFQVYAQPREVAVAVAEAAEKHRKRLAEEWLGRELPAWPKPCPVTVEIAADKSGGASTFKFDADKLQTLEMKLFGPLPQLVGSTVPHEVMHCVLATHFGRALPRWADEGLAVLAESAEEQHAHDVRCRELLNQGRCIQLANLFKMTEYPRDMAVLFAQGYSVCQFLLTRDSKLIDQFADATKSGIGVRVDRDLARRQLLIMFVAAGANEGWDETAKRAYGFESVDKLEAAWLQFLHQKPPSRVPTPPAAISPSGMPSPFAVTGVSPGVARAIRNELDLQRQLIARKWTGTDPRPMGHESVRVGYRPAGAGTAGRSYLNTGGIGRRLPESIELFGPLDRVLEYDIPAVLVKSVFTEQFAFEPPGWASAGLMAVEDHPAEQRALDAAARKLIADGQAVKLSAFFKDAVWHTPDTRAQGHSVIRFLMNRTADLGVQGVVDGSVIRRELTAGGDPAARGVFVFLNAGHNSSWEQSARAVYGFKDVDDLEAQWIAWLKTPGSKLPPEPPATPTPPLPAPRIPATKVDGP
ncbi:MAG: sigma-70 family RNA polymerase sigma factor [Gemmataceae bacterium]